MPEEYLEVINRQVEEYNGDLEIEESSTIPNTNDIPLDAPRWKKIPDVICVFVDMKNSTLLSATAHERSTSRTYQLFTGTAVRLFDAFEAPYIDVRGDGAFALFNKNQVYRALAAAVTFKTFAEKVFIPKIQKKTDLEIGAHIGIDQRTVLVRKLGLRRIEGRTDRQNEVWAGKPVNMASKLASIGESGQLLASERYYEKITHERARLSCGCRNGNPSSTKSDLWKAIDVSDKPMFDFNTAWQLTSSWCSLHGKEFCSEILKLDKE